MCKKALLISPVLLLSFAAFVVYAQPLTPVSTDNWGLKIVFFNVGQADAAVILSPNGEAFIIDMGKTIDHGRQIGDFLLDENQNGVGEIDEAFLFTSHYDGDHIGGAKGLSEKKLGY